jgi:aldehyde:ferredoxin oxidoreductase
MNTLCRALNVREGLSARDDTLPKRFFQQIGDPKPTTDTLDPEEFRAAQQFYYAAMGWTPDGIPTKHKLDELGVGWAYDIMETGRLGEADLGQRVASAD